jgi:hypothetical protein
MTKVFLTLTFLMTFFNKCGRDAAHIGEPVARVEDSYLYSDEVEKIIPQDINSEDSARIAQSFINEWMRKQVVINQARFNLPSEEIDFEKQIQDYEDALLMYKYERKLIEQKLDTFVTDFDIETYFKKAKSNYLLQEPAYRLFYFKLDSGSHNSQKVAKQVMSSNANEIEKLRVYCENNALEYFFDDTRWIKHSAMVDKLPKHKVFPNMFQRINFPIKINHQGISYYFLISEIAPKGTAAPINLVSNEIRIKMLNDRKLTLIQKMRNDLFNEALNNKNAEIFK